MRIPLYAVKWTLLLTAFLLCGSVVHAADPPPTIPVTLETRIELLDRLFNRWYLGLKWSEQDATSWNRLTPLFVIIGGLDDTAFAPVLLFARDPVPLIRQ